MTKVRYVEAMYNTAITWDIEDIAERYDFKIEDIANMEVGKWVKLFITLKDGPITKTIPKNVTKNKPFTISEIFSLSIIIENKRTYIG